jgi:hypothetical protein
MSNMKDIATLITADKIVVAAKTHQDALTYIAATDYSEEQKYILRVHADANSSNHLK